MKYIWTTLVFGIFFSTPVFSENYMTEEVSVKNSDKPIECKEGQFPHGKCICSYSCKTRKDNPDGKAKCEQGEYLDCYEIGLNEFVCSCVKQINIDEDDINEDNFKCAFEIFCQGLGDEWDSEKCECCSEKTQKRTGCALKPDHKWVDEKCECIPLTPEEQEERNNQNSVLENIFGTKEDM